MKIVLQIQIHTFILGDGIIRYSRDGVVFLDRKNEEQWIQPVQLQNPIIEVRDDAFAVADSGGNSIYVFTEDGLKGEIETTLPIEKIFCIQSGNCKRDPEK